MFNLSESIEIGFNSSKVQLEQNDGVCDEASDQSFNSSKVQLEQG